MKKLSLTEIWATLRIKVLALLGSVTLRALNATLSWQDAGYDGDFGTLEREGPFILAFWHNRQLFASFAYWHRKDRSKAIPIYALISEHADGRIIAQAVRYLGIRSVAGSSTRRGREALFEMGNCLKQGESVAITPDGPRGPIYKCKAGIIKLAQTSGRPIYPLSIGAKRKWEFKSWDRMILPKPFSKAVRLVGPPLSVPRELSEQEFSAYQEDLEKRLNALCEQADNFNYLGAS